MRYYKKKTQSEEKTAIVYCESNFGSLDGKTANGLVRHSEKYKIIGVIDSEKAGYDTGIILNGKANGIPIFSNLTEAIEKSGSTPDYFIFGVAPASGFLSPDEREVILDAVKMGINIVNGLHEFLNDDPIFAAASSEMNVELIDIRKPPPKKNLRLFNGRILEIDCVRIAILGTDCAIGKRTTANILNKVLNDYGLKSVMISTGQTGLIQGARYGIALDAVPSQFCAGELEATIIEAYERESPDVVIIEGQGSLGHPAYSTSSFILRGSCPQGVILQHAPKRVYRCDFEQLPMPLLSEEVNLIQTFSKTKVIGLTINHEDMNEIEINEAVVLYESELGIPVTDPLTQPYEHLLKMVVTSFPHLIRRHAGNI